MSETSDKFIDKLLEFVRMSREQEERCKEYTDEQIKKRLGDVRKVKLWKFEASEDFIIKMVMFSLIAFLALNDLQKEQVLQYFKGSNPEFKQHMNTNEVNLHKGEK